MQKIAVAIPEATKRAGPAAPTEADGVENVKPTGAVFDGFKPDSEPFDYQAAYLAQRYRLSPRMARLVSYLAEIGGRLA